MVDVLSFKNSVAYNLKQASKFVRRFFRTEYFEAQLSVYIGPKFKN